MELFDATKNVTDYRLDREIFVQFYERFIKQYLNDGVFLDLKAHYLKNGINIVNYSTIYNQLQQMFLADYRLLRGEVNHDSLKNSQNICMIILNKYIPLYELSEIPGKNPHDVRYEYIFVSLTGALDV